MVYIKKRIAFLKSLIARYKEQDIDTAKFEAELKQKQQELETLS